MYKYTKTKQYDFMSNPLRAFLMGIFITSEQGQEFIKSKTQDNLKEQELSDLKFKKIKDEMDVLKEQALKTLSSYEDPLTS